LAWMDSERIDPCDHVRRGVNPKLRLHFRGSAVEFSEPCPVVVWKSF
jgi:hypothetical protein